MGAEHTQDWRQGIASALEWWRDAGVETLVEDEPRDWLARPVAMPAAAADAPAVASAPAEILPTTLGDFVAWRLSDAAPEAKWMSRMISPTGPANPELVVLADMPDSDDAETLLSGSAGGLFDRMLAAIGLSRESVYLCSLAVARPMSGQIPPDQHERLLRLATHHLSLLKPQKLLLFGKPVHQLLPGKGAGDGLEEVNLFGGNTVTVASYHPRFLMTTPVAKSEAWKHLLLLSRGSE